MRPRRKAVSVIASWIDYGHITTIHSIISLTVAQVFYVSLDDHLLMYQPWQKMPALMKRLSPILWTKDLKETIRFYQNVLGFTAKSSFPNFVSLTRGNVEIMFVVPQGPPEECQDSNDKVEFFPRPVLTGSIFIVTDQVDELWESVKDKATIKDSIDDREYRMRDFSIFDNNGYEIVFGQDIP